MRKQKVFDMMKYVIGAAGIALILSGCDTQRAPSIESPAVETVSDGGGGGSEIQFSSDDMYWVQQQQQQKIDDDLAAQRVAEELAREQERQRLEELARDLNQQDNQTIQDFTDAWNQHQQ